MPFYRAMFTRLHRLGKNPAVIIKGPDRTAVEYLEANGLAAKTLVDLTFYPQLSRVTPTTLITDTQGFVKFAWVGVLDGKEQYEIAAAMSVPQFVP